MFGRQELRQNAINTDPCSSKRGLPSSFISSDIADNFNDIRKQIRKNLEKQHTFLGNGSSNYMVSCKAKKQTNLNSNDNKQNCHQRQASSNSIYSTITQQSNAYNRNADKENYKQYEQFIYSRESNNRQSKINLLKNDLKQMLSTQQPDTFTQQFQSYSNRSSSSFYNNNQDNNDNHRILISQLASPSVNNICSESQATPRDRLSRIKAPELINVEMINNQIDNQSLTSRNSSVSQLRASHTTKQQQVKTPQQNKFKNIFNQNENVYSPTQFTQDSRSTLYYEKGPTSEARNILTYKQEISNILSKEEIYKIQNALLEANEQQIQKLPYSYVCELKRLAEIIDKTLSVHQHI